MCDCEKQEIIDKIIKICKESADNMAVLDLQVRILQAIEEQSRQKIKRSECPYGGIDCMWCMEECE